MAKLLLCCAGLCLLASLGFFDFEAEVAERNEYCENVANNLWPDYKKIYKTECKKLLHL